MDHRIKTIRAITTLNKKGILLSGLQGYFPKQKIIKSISVERFHEVFTSMFRQFSQKRKILISVFLILFPLFFLVGGVVNVENSDANSSYGSQKDSFFVSEGDNFWKNIDLSLIGVSVAKAQDDGGEGGGTNKNATTSNESLGDWASSTIGGLVLKILTMIAHAINTIVGQVIAVMISILVSVANYGDITEVPTVQEGWKIVRDICNMFIVLILLFIAFSTILRVESYNAKKALPKLLIVAIVINFSRAIFGLIIGFSQVVMLSFAAPLAETNGAWFVEIFNLQYLDSIEGSGPLEGWQLAGAAILGMFAGIVTLIVIVVMLAVLVIRLVMLWVYTILSPLVFLGFAFPPLQKYVGSIWQDFIKQVIVGPLLMFFIWLALTTAHDSANKFTSPGGGEEMSAMQSVFFQESNLQRFIIAISLLVGGLMATQQIGGAVGSAAGKGMEAIKGRYGPTPMRWGRERLDAFNSKREGERKQKAGKGGQRLYGLYKGTTQAPQAAGKGVQKATGIPGVGEMWRGVSQGASNIPGIKQVKQWKQEKQKHQSKINEAFEQGREITSDDGQYIYTPDENKVQVKDKKTGQEVTSMGKKEADFRRGFEQGYSPAKQVMDETKKQDVDDKQKELANMDASELKQILEDRDSSMTDKIAASLLNVQKQNFSEGEQDKFNKAKENAKQSLSTKKSFNEEADKKYAAWNNTKEEFTKKADNGDIDLNKQDLSQYKEKIDYFAEAAGDNFGKVVDEVSKRGAKADETVTKTLKDKVESYDNVDTKDPEQKKIRKGYAEKTGNFVHAYSSPDGQQDQEAMQDFAKSAKSDRLNKIATAYQREDTPPKQQETMKRVMSRSLNKKQVDNYEKKDVPEKNVETLKSFLQENQTSDQDQKTTESGSGNNEGGNNNTSDSGQFTQNTEE